MQFIAAPPAAVAAAVLGPGWGLYCTVEIIKALEFASSLFFATRLFRFHGYLAPISSAKCKSEAEDGL